MRFLNRKPLAVVIAAVIIVLVAGAGAYAYWTSGGGGTGTAGTGASEDLVVVQTSIVTGLAPGVAAQNLSGNFDNSGDGPVYAGSVSVVVTDTNAPGCTADDYTITGSPMTVNAEVPVGSGQGGWTGAQIAFNNDPVRNQDACQGATVNLTYEVIDTP
jgi:hypothetical protein